MVLNAHVGHGRERRKRHVVGAELVAEQPLLAWTAGQTQVVQLEFVALLPMGKPGVRGVERRRVEGRDNRKRKV